MNRLIRAFSRVALRPNILRNRTKLTAKPFNTRFPNIFQFSDQNNQDPNQKNSNNEGNNGNQGEDPENGNDPGKKPNPVEKFLEYTNPQNWDPQHLKIIGAIGLLFLVNYFFKDYWEYEMISNIDPVEFWTQLENRDIRKLEVIFIFYRFFGSVFFIF